MNLAYFEAQAALATMLRSTTPDEVPVDISPLEVAAEHVWIPGTSPEPLTRTYAQSGLVASDERFEILVVFLTEWMSRDFTELVARMKRLVDPFTEALGANPTLDHLLMLCIITRADMDEAMKDEQTRQLSIVLTVSCTAHVVKSG